MATATRTVNEPFVRIRLVKFSVGAQSHPLQNIKLRVETFDFQQVSTARPKFPEYDKKMNNFCFETRAKQGRQVTIDVYMDVKKTNYTHKTSIEDLIRRADNVIREYRFSDKSQASMSIELLIPNDNVREAQRTIHNKIRKHYGHEFLPKYFTTLPVFCSDCKKVLWGFNTPGYRCQLCDLVVHEQCIKNVVTCKQLGLSDSPAIPTVSHNFLHEPNFLPLFCDHDGKIIHPLRAWKCSNCEMIVHSKCKKNVAHFCGTRQVAVRMYEEWKEQNKSDSIDAYVITDDCTTTEIEENNQTQLINIYERLQHERERDSAIQDLNVITKPYQWSDNLNQTSVVLLHNISFHALLGHGMSGSVYWVKYSEQDFALKALRKHRIFEANEFECVKNERDILLFSRDNPFIIQLYAVFHDFQRVYFLLEYANCGAFYEFLLTFGSKFDNACIKWFSSHIICAISYLHSKLVIHRDLKPENVLLMRDGRLKLADFGFSKQLISATGTTRTFCGTSEYIAPEIYQNFDYGFPVDYWSLGVMIYEMITLQTPFYHPSEYEIKEHVINKDFQYPPKITSDLQSVITGLLTKNPNERFGINELRSSTFYSSPYSLEDIEQGNIKCPWKRTIPLNPSPDKHLSMQTVRLSQIDEQSICTTLTLNKNNFRHFSFIGF
ncbi:unnamed protein product [Adineta steineri]|uniref:protein kinase C n=1 Tax=Adineta steineri TaxID=433720 RepID=A0A818H979_9BILA|nr:unnamed protein product [Adineta steineri]